MNFYYAETRGDRDDYYGVEIVYKQQLMKWIWIENRVYNIFWI